MISCHANTRAILTVILSISLITLNIGCATSEKSILTGAAAGGAIGAGIGSQAGDGRNAAIGAATGLALGGLIGWLGYKDKQKKMSKISDKNKSNEDLPFITKPLIRKYNPEPKIEGNKYIRNCEIFEIKENAKWRD